MCRRKQSSVKDTFMYGGRNLQLHLLCGFVALGRINNTLINRWAILSHEVLTTCV